MVFASVVGGVVSNKDVFTPPTVAAILRGEVEAEDVGDLAPEFDPAVSVE